MYLVHRFPYPPDKGDRIRSFNLLKFLSRRAAVHVACLADEEVDPAAETALRGYCERLATVRLGKWGRWMHSCSSLLRGRTATEGAFRSPEFQEIISSWGRETCFHACVASASSMVPYLKLPELRDKPAVVDLVDVDSEKWLDYAAASRGPKAWLYKT